MNILYDSIIIGFLIADTTLMYLLIHNERYTLPYILLLAACVISWLVIFYGSFIEPRMLTVNKHAISLGTGTTQHLRVALISDIHVGPYKGKDYVTRIVEKTMFLNPDLIILDGDFVYDNANQMPLAAPLKDLHAPLGVFAVLGNHDYGEGSSPQEIIAADPHRKDAIKEMLQAFGVEVLVNQGVKLQKGTKDFVLLGTDEVWSGHASIVSAIETLGSDKDVRPRILVSHNPDMVLDAQYQDIDLVLSGHTHGGQIRLPFIGPVPQLPDRLGRHYDMGLFNFDKTQLFITSGVGEQGARARLFVPPEIALLDIAL